MVDECAAEHVDADLVDHSFGDLEHSIISIVPSGRERRHNNGNVMKFR
jgi:hypothetical protein